MRVVAWEPEWWTGNQCGGLGTSVVVREPVWWPGNQCGGPGTSMVA